MKVLFIGGTGNLSSDCTRRALSLGMEVHHLNRGSSAAAPPAGVGTHIADIRDSEAVDAALGTERFDSVVQFIAYEPDQVAADLTLFRGRTDQYVFISSASAYRKPHPSGPLDETCPLENPWWPYSRAKIECERLLEAAGAASGMAITVVRPSHTYGDRWIPSAFGSSDFTVARRILEGREIIVHGDGSALWTITHARDFAVALVGLLGNRAAYGEAVQIMGEEALSWDELHREVARALGAQARIVHVPVDFIAAQDSGMGERLLGDKAWTSLFDCSKLRRLVPEFRTAVPFRSGIRESVAWYLADPARQKVNPATDSLMDRILAAWRKIGPG